MRKITLFTFLIALSSTSFADSNVEIVERFSRSLIEIVKRSNKDEFKKIGCVKIPCGNIGLQYIFGDNDSSAKFREIMSYKDISFKVFGPYTVEPEYENSSYTILFYSLSNSPFDNQGGINEDYGYAELYKSFLQTQITIIDGKVLFQRVPFYLESHHPYVGDYG